MDNLKKLSIGCVLVLLGALGWMQAGKDGALIAMVAGLTGIACGFEAGAASVADSGEQDSAGSTSDVVDMIDQPVSQGSPFEGHIVEIRQTYDATRDVASWIVRVHELHADAASLGRDFPDNN